MSVLTLVAALGILGPVETDTLDQYRWEKRPIVVFSDEDDPRLARQMARFEANRADLADRDNVIVLDTSEDSALRRRFRPAAFTVILVGKDGTEKARTDDVVDLDSFEALIDTMPMRRREMREDG